MAAPLGFKTFNTGDVLSAADTNGYLMQGVLVFADAAARSAAITSPQEGQTSYLKDTDVIQVYSGSSWVTKSGGSSPLTTKGDLYTYSTTDARLAVGTNGHTLVADSSTATGLKWAAASSGALVKISRTTYSNVATQAFDNVFDSTYSTYLINIEKTAGSSNSDLLFQWRKNSSTVSSGYYGNTFGYNYAGSARNTANSSTSALTIMTSQGPSNDRWSTAQLYANFVGYTKTTGERSLVNGTGLVAEQTWTTVIGGGLYDAGGDNCNGFILSASSGNIYGTVTIYGVAI